MLPLLSAMTALAGPVGPHIGLTAADHAGAPTFRADQPIVGTYFFYWYNDRTGEHFVDHDGTDAMTTHPLRRPGEPYSYDSETWWRGELADVRAAGLDYIAPVYWGTPEDDPAFAWSFVGLQTLARVIAAQRAAGEPVVPVAMFYDTSTLRANRSQYHAELDTERGRAWFYETIRGFWSHVPPDAWCRIDGRPLILLYGPDFAKTHSPDLFADTKRRFVAEFGVEPFLVKHAGWPGEADGVVTWGGALGLKHGTVAAVGPGYDHSAVPGRQPLIVEREGGAFYQDQWHRLLAMDPATRPTIAIVETWNEFHEGTDVAPSVEYGRLYVEWTAWFAAQWHAGGRYPRGFDRRPEVVWQAGADGGGVTLKAGGDGLFEPTAAGGRPAVVTRANPHGPARYLYFDADWGWAYDLTAGVIEVELTFQDAGCRSIGLEYDSRDPAGSVREGAFKSAGAVTVGGAGAWRTHTFRLTDPRLADRCNTADLRLVADGGEITVGRLVLRRVP